MRQVNGGAKGGGGGGETRCMHACMCMYAWDACTPIWLAGTFVWVVMGVYLHSSWGVVERIEVVRAHVWPPCNKPPPFWF